MSTAAFIESPTRIQAAGNKPKQIEEFIGRVNSKHSHTSIARMKSRAGWVEPGQTPDFDEYTLVLKGLLRVEFLKPDGEVAWLDVEPNQAVVTHRGEWVRYSTPGEQGAEYVAVCAPAFTLDSARRDGC